MKKIYSILFAAVALFAFASMMSAQTTEDIPFPADNHIKFAPSEWNKPYEINEDSGVAYRKIISKPNTQGVYHIMLDAFVTGREITIQKSLPADIVLVLDMSGSMNESYGGSQTYNVESNTNWNYSNSANRFIQYEGEYYAVQRGRYDRGRYQNPRYYYYFYFSDSEGNQYYLSGEDIIPATREIRNNMNNPEHYVSGSNGNVTVYTGTFYSLGVPSKLQSLKSAVETFINIIDDNDLEHAPNGRDRLGNRIAIVTFAYSGSTIMGFTPLSDKASLISAVRALTANGATYADAGMELAYELLEGSSSQLKTTVLFTDGNPGRNGNWTQAGDNYRVATWNTANNTINIANNIKNLKEDSEDPLEQVISNVFTVSVIQSPEPYTNVYLGKTSSNYLGATNMGSYETWNSSDIWSNGNGTKNNSETNFALTASSASELENAFATIAAASGGSSEALGESSVSTVDVVSTSFMLPPNSDATSIHVYTAPCESVASSGQPTFGTYVLADDRTDKYQPMKKENGILVPDGPEKDVDDSIVTGLDGNKITVDGFDFSNLWCGEVVENGQHVDWHGYKMTVLIPIKMNPDALGGVGVETNGEGSGIFIDGKNEFPFISPQVNLPVNIIINKQGLGVGESSKFTILRKTAAESAWEPVTSVFVTRHSGQGENAPRTRIEGLPATNSSGVEYIYMVREDDWSWSYTLTSNAELTTKDSDNPFTFTNKKKNNIDTKIRHAESKATNTFKTGGNAAYDDSKSNNRTVITVE